MKKQGIRSVPPAFGQEKANSFKIKNLASKQQPEKQGKMEQAEQKKLTKNILNRAVAILGWNI